MAKVKLKNIDANPWRHMGRYPIRRDKVDALKESIATTDWWSNVLARPHPDNPERVQLAFGHHRRQALLELFDPDHEVDLIVRDLDNETMIKMMARENMEEYGSSAAAEHETVRTIVEAFASGEITFDGAKLSHVGHDQELVKKILRLREQGKSKAAIAKAVGIPEHQVRTVLEGFGTFRIKSASGKIRIAPSFIMYGTHEVPGHLNRGKAYSAPDIAKFTGWTQTNGDPQWKVHNALNVLEVIELGILTEEDFDGLTSWQAGAVAQEAKNELATRKSLANLEKRPEVKERILANGVSDVSDMAQHIISDLKSKERGSIEVKESAARSGKLTPKTPKEPPKIDAFAERLATAINKMLEARPTNRQVYNLELFIEFQDKATARSRKDLAVVLRQLADKATKYADQLKIGEEDEKVIQLGTQVQAIEGGRE